MVSPDATPYVDLRLFDRDAQEVFELALVNLRTYLSEWQPREGHTEVLLMESLALMVEEAIFSVNRVPGAVVEVLLRLYDVVRDLGAAPTATLLFTATDSNGYTIPVGTRVAMPLLGGDQTIVFSTDAPLVIAAGQLTGSVSATGDQFTSVANGTVAGAAVEMLDSVAPVEQVALASTVTGGRDVESDEEWFTRGIQRFSRLAETLVLPRHFVSAALERTEVSRATAIDNYDPNQAGSPGAHAGHVTVAVYGDGDVLTVDQREAIRVAFDLQAQANLAVHVVSPQVTLVNITASVVGTPGYSVAQVQAFCTAALTDYLSPEQWGWGTTVYRNELIGLLDRVEGVERVNSVTVPNGDLALTGVAPLAKLGTASITVTGL